MNGLRVGTPELVRRGVTPADAPALAALIAEGLRSNAPETVAPRTRASSTSRWPCHPALTPSSIERSATRLWTSVSST